MSAQRPAGFRLFPTARAFPTTASSIPDRHPATGFRLLIPSVPCDIAYRNSTGFDVEIAERSYTYIDGKPEKILHRLADFFSKVTIKKISDGSKLADALMRK